MRDKLARIRFNSRGNVIGAEENFRVGKLSGDGGHVRGGKVLHFLLRGVTLLYLCVRFSCYNNNNNLLSIQYLTLPFPGGAGPLKARL